MVCMAQNHNSRSMTVMKKEWMELKPRKPMLKRFYKTVSVERGEEGWQVLLDGKPIRTPGKELLAVPSKKLAQSIAQEWEAQGEEIDLQALPMMQFSCAALDYVTSYREEVLAELVEYAATDALCYRAGEPLALVLQQRTEWQPHLDWAQSTYGAHLKLTKGIMPMRQDEDALDILHAHLARLGIFPLTVVWLCTRHCGSLVLGLAVEAGRLDPVEAYTVSRLEERFQNTQWGEDEEARTRREAGEREMAAIGAFLRALD